jgi:hypothetical protein
VSLSNLQTLAESRISASAHRTAEQSLGRRKKNDRHVFRFSKTSGLMPKEHDASNFAVRKVLISRF